MRYVSYPKIRHTDLVKLAEMDHVGNFYIQEKVDGSQFSFYKIDGRLHYHTKNTELSSCDINNKQFGKTISEINSRIDLVKPHHIYRGEALRGRKQNKLCYDNEPLGNFVLFDIETVSGNRYDSLSQEVVSTHAEYLNVAYPGYTIIENIQYFEDVKPEKSFLGGPLEGYVIKSYDWNQLSAWKIVNKEFEESVKPLKKHTNIINDLQERYSCTGRFEKVISTMKNRGVELNSSTFGQHLKELFTDFDVEYSTEAKEIVWKWAKRKFLDKLSKDFRDFAFNKEDNNG